MCMTLGRVYSFQQIFKMFNNLITYNFQLVLRSDPQEAHDSQSTLKSHFTVTLVIDTAILEVKCVCQGVAG